MRPDLSLLVGCGLAAVTVTGLADTPPAADAGSAGPWETYNAGVCAYAAGEYALALDRWESLSQASLPRRLRLPVWFQLGNAQFRVGEPYAGTAPEQAAELWRRSVAAYETALTVAPRDPSSRHNLDLVRRRLALLLHQVGIKTFAASTNRPVDEAIPLIRESLTRLDEAVVHQPQDAAIRADRDRVEDAFRSRLLERAATAEQQADEQARARSEWSDYQAESRYRDALSDIAEASPPPRDDPPPGSTPPSEAGPQPGTDRPPSAAALDQAAAAAEQRVHQKLADLLTRMGQREQKEGQARSEWNPDEALGHFESALQRFVEAQSVQPEHEAARQGEREVRQAMEQLHVREGQDALRQGKEQLARQSPQAAPSLTTALENFEAARQLNPLNAAAEAGAEEARRLLPEALALAGQAQMQAGDRAADNNPGEALARYQESETDFQQALDMQPGQPQAQQGLEDLQPRLARMRAQVAQEAEQAARQAVRPNRPTPSLQDLLDQVTERDRPLNPDRERQRARNQPGERRNTRDW